MKIRLTLCLVTMSIVTTNARATETVFRFYSIMRMGSEIKDARPFIFSTAEKCSVERDAQASKAREMERIGAQVEVSPCGTASADWFTGLGQIDYTRSSR